MRIWNCCSDWCKNMENELSKESDSVGLFAYSKIKYLKLHLKWTIIPAEDVVLRRRHALITVGSGYGSDGNADRCIAVIARDTDSNFYGVLRHRKPEISMISGFFRGIFCYRWDLNCYIFKICPEKSHGHSRIELRRQCILDHILSLCIGISVKAVAAESSPFIVVTDHFSDGIDIDTSVYQ